MFKFKEWDEKLGKANSKNVSYIKDKEQLFFAFQQANRPKEEEKWTAAVHAGIV